MEERLNDGEEVLIFRNVSDIYAQNESDFIKGFIVESEKSKNLSYQGKPFYVWIYRVIGEDNKEYSCCNGMIIYGHDYIRRPIDYLKDIRRHYLNNIQEIKRLEEINKGYVKTLNSINNLCKKK